MTTRRHFITKGTCALTGLNLSRGAETDSRGWIDAHVHVWPNETKKYPVAKGYDKSGLRAGFTPEDLFAECRPQGVSRIVLIQMSFYQFDNTYMLDVMSKYKGVFGSVAIIDEKAPNLTERMRKLKERGIRGFRVYANAKNASSWVDSKPMRAMWQEAAKNKQSICCLADPEALPAITRLCRKHPETPVVIDHFARIGMRGPVDQDQLDQLLKLADFKHVAVKTSAFYALGAKKAPYKDLGPMIRQLRNAFGAQRLMWASDCPFQVEGGHTYRDSIALIRDRLDFLTAEDKEWMLRKTAERVFF